jgi:Uma2 family endonuclease
MEVVTVTPTEIAEPRVLRWTRDEYYRLAEAGVFEGRRVELIRGEIFEMSPQKSEHAAVVTHIDGVFRALFEPSGFCVRIQCPLALGADSDPELDVAVVSGKPLDYRHAHPRTAALVLEVADTTLASDRGRKASLYASAGLADYWILNLIDRQLEVRRDPIPDTEQRYGFGYATAAVFTGGDVVSLLTVPGITVAVADLLP